MSLIIPATKNVLKRYLLFFGSPYYPIGGMNDLYGQYDSFEEVAIALDEESEGSGDYWAHILDTWEGRKILSYGYDSHPVQNYLKEGFLHQHLSKLSEPSKEYVDTHLRNAKRL